MPQPEPAMRETFEPEHGVDTDGAVRLLHVRDVLKSSAPPEWLVQGVLEEGVLAMFLGAAESAKSLWLQRAAACIATGTPMDGRRVKAGPVVYLCGEGRLGLQRRFRALEVDLGIALADAPLLVCFEAPSLCDPAAAERVRTAIDQVQQRYGPPALVGVDTMSRHMAGGDENRAADAGLFFDNARRAAPAATIAVVHHTGWIEGARNRGSSAIKGAVDQELFFRKDGDLVSVTAGKMKDGEQPGDMHYRIKVVNTGLCREDGSPLDSVTLEPTDAAPVESRGALTPTERMALDTLREAIKTAGKHPPPEILNRNKLNGQRCVEEADWRDIFYRRRTSEDDTPEARRKAFKRARDKLQMSRLIQADDGFYWALEQPGQAGHDGTF
jgi:hypothetical protein